MFTIFGATGNTGKVVAEKLLDAGRKVRLAVRDASKVKALVDRGAEVVVADVLDAKSVAAALAGAEGAYLLAPPDGSSTDFIARNHRVFDNFVAGLRGSSVKHVVLLSSVGAHLPAGTGPIASLHYAETELAKLPGLRVTSVRAAYFMENVLNYAHPIKGDGVLPVFGGGEQYPFPMIATHDIGVTAAEALLAPPAASEVIELTGPQPYSLNDAAAAASKILGRPVAATALPIEAMVPTLTGFGMSANVAGLYREMTEGFGKGLIAYDGKGRAVKGTTTLEQVLRAGLA